MKTKNRKGMAGRRGARRGLTLIEMVIAIFITAAVIGGTLLLLAANMSVLAKAVEMQVATALAQYQADLVRAVDFPPVYTNNVIDLGDVVYPESACDPMVGTDFTPSEFKEPQVQERLAFVVHRYVFRYAADGTELDSATHYDSAMYAKVSTHVFRKKGMYPLVTVKTHVSRNSLY